MIAKTCLVLSALIATAVALPVNTSIRQNSAGGVNDPCNPGDLSACEEGLTCTVVRGQETGICQNLEGTKPFVARIVSAQALVGNQGDACHVDVPGHCSNETRCLFAINPANGVCQDASRFDPLVSPSPVEINSPPTDDQPCNPNADVPCADDLTCIFVDDGEGVCMSLERTNPFVARVVVATAVEGSQGQGCHTNVPGHCEDGLLCLSGLNSANGVCANLGN